MGEIMKVKIEFVQETWSESKGLAEKWALGEVDL